MRALNLAPMIRLVFVIQVANSRDMQWLIRMIFLCPINRICLGAGSVQGGTAVCLLDSESTLRALIDKKAVICHNVSLFFATLKVASDLPNGRWHVDSIKLIRDVLVANVAVRQEII
jgi:hypothetical protein